MRWSHQPGADIDEQIRRHWLAGVEIRASDFCSHAILFNFAGIVFRRFFGNYGSDLFPITFFSLPFLAVGAAVIGLHVIGGSRTLLFLFNAGHAAPPLRKEEQPVRQQAAGPRRMATSRD